MIVIQEVAVTQFHEQIRVHRFQKPVIPDVHVRIRRERTGLRTAMGIYMEESTACCHASAVSPLVPRKRQQDRTGNYRAKIVHRRPEILPLLIAGSQMPGFIRHGDEFNLDHQFASAVRKHL